MKTYFTHVSGMRRAPRFIDVTDAVQDAIARSEIANGWATVIGLDRRDRVLVNEGESGLFRDLEEATSHVGAKAMLVGGQTVTVPARQGRALLGEWQRILVLTSPGARTETVALHLIGE